MANRASILGRVAAASSLALLLSAPVYAVDQYGNNNNYPRVSQNGRISVEGRITNMTRQGGKYDVTLDNGATYKLSRATVRDNNLAVGQFVHFDGYMRGRNAFVENVMLSSDPNWNYSRSYPTNGYGYGNGNTNANSMTGIVESTNRHLNYFTVRDPNGRQMKVDVRNMDTRRSVNVWNLRPGDRVSVNGGWESGDTFRADSVNF